MVSQEENVDRALKSIDEQIGLLTNPHKKPDQFVRDLHREWKIQGGKVLGKSRHSDRHLEDRLRSEGTPIRSLTPKLADKTLLRAEDARILVDFFLRNWPKLADDHQVEYGPLISERLISSLAKAIEDNITARKIYTSEGEQASLPGEDIEALIVKMYSESDALITVSPEHTLIVAHPGTELIGFRNLMNKLHEAEASARKERPLIWVLDLGWRIFDDPESRMKFLNVASLITRFKALEVFRDPGQKDRWDWLCKRAVIVMLDWTRHPSDKVIDFPRPDFSANHVSFAEIKSASAWLRDANFRALYGKELEHIEAGSFSVFFNSNVEWKTPGSGLENELRYFGYGQFSKDTNHTGLEARGLELPSPGTSYDDAFKVVYAAAVHVSGLKSELLDKIKISGENAVKQLNYLGYNVLKLHEFLGSIYGP